MTRGTSKCSSFTRATYVSPISTVKAGFRPKRISHASTVLYGFRGINVRHKGTVLSVSDIRRIRKCDPEIEWFKKNRQKLESVLPVQIRGITYQKDFLVKIEKFIERRKAMRPHLAELYVYRPIGELISYIERSAS